MSDFISFAAVALRCASTHFACHHSETSALLARAGCFHRGVERQYIGLESNAFNCTDNLDHTF